MVRTMDEAPIPAEQRRSLPPSLRPGDLDLWLTVCRQRPPLCSFAWDKGGWALRERAHPSEGASPSNRWRRQWWAFQGLFAFYFNDDKLSSPCQGCVYLGGCHAEELPQYGGRRHCLRLESRLPRQPELEGNHVVTIGCRTAEQLRVWAAHIHFVSSLDKDSPSPEGPPYPEELEVPLTPAPPPLMAIPLPRSASSSLFSLVHSNSLYSLPSQLVRSGSHASGSLAHIPWLSVAPAPHRASGASTASYCAPPLCPVLPSTASSPCVDSLACPAQSRLSSGDPPPEGDPPIRPPPAPMRADHVEGQPTFGPARLSPDSPDSEGVSPSLAPAKPLHSWEGPPGSPMRVSAAVAPDPLSSPSAPALVSPAAEFRFTLRPPNDGDTPHAPNPAAPPPPHRHPLDDSPTVAALPLPPRPPKRALPVPARWPAEAMGLIGYAADAAFLDGDDFSDSDSGSSSDEDADEEKPSKQGDAMLSGRKATELTAPYSQGKDSARHSPTSDASVESDGDFIIVAPDRATLHTRSQSLPPILTPRMPNAVHEGRHAAARQAAEVAALRAELRELAALQLGKRWRRFRERQRVRQEHQERLIYEQQRQITDLQQSLQSLMLLVTASTRPAGAGEPPVAQSPHGLASPCASSMASLHSSTFSPNPQLRVSDQMTPMQLWQGQSPVWVMSGHRLPTQRLPLPPQVLEANAQRRQRRMNALQAGASVNRPMESPTATSVRHNPAINPPTSHRLSLPSPYIYAPTVEAGTTPELHGSTHA